MRSNSSRRNSNESESDESRRQRYLEEDVPPNYEEVVGSKVFVIPTNSWTEQEPHGTANKG